MLVTNPIDDEQIFQCGNLGPTLLPAAPHAGARIGRQITSPAR